MANAVTAMIGILLIAVSSLIQRVRSRPGHFGQLDVHDDEVGLVLAREIDGLESVAAFDRLEAESIQQVAEELHVELVVFDDEDFLWLARSPSAHHA